MFIRSVRRLVVLGCLTLTCAAPTSAQEGIPESLRRLFESLPTARLPEGARGWPERAGRDGRGRVRSRAPRCGSDPDRRDERRCISQRTSQKATPVK
jgi:hypothetical protein